jgi:FtsZ-binding cell division protein ZapB
LTDLSIINDLHNYIKITLTSSIYIHLHHVNSNKEKLHHEKLSLTEETRKFDLQGKAQHIQGKTQHIQQNATFWEKHKRQLAGKF